MNRPHVTTVVPAFQAHRTLRRAVNSALAQDYRPHEVLVVDDGSDPPMRRIVSDLGSRIRCLRHESNRGAAAARNTAIAAARGELIAFLDADDYWEPDKLARQVLLYNRHQDLGLCFSRYFRQVPGQPRQLAAWPWAIPSETLVTPSRASAARLAALAWTGTVMAPRQLLLRHPFLSGLEPAEDRHVWIRLAADAPSYCLSQPLATAVLTEGSLSRSRFERDCANMLRAIQLTSRILGRSRRIWEARVYRRWAAEYLGQGLARNALLPAIRRWCRQPLSAEAMWIVLKSLGLAGRALAVAGPTGVTAERCS